MKAITLMTAVFIILISIIVGIYIYPELPEQVASHWNAKGEVDGHISKFWGAFLMPIVMAGMLLLFYLIPKIDPLKKNVKKFRKYFDGFILMMLIFFLYIYLLTLFWNVGYRFDLGSMMMPAIGILFFYLGVMMKHSKRNWFIGIRTPWTLSSDKVWDKTHKVGGRLFKIAGILALIGIFFQKHSLWFVLIPIIVFSVYTVIYSYFEYKKECKIS
ncbi:SdpI family protein [Patescibacteria group bacterium]